MSDRRRTAAERGAQRRAPLARAALVALLVPCVTVLSGAASPAAPVSQIATPSGTTTPAPTPADAMLAARAPALPVEGVHAGALRDTFLEGRPGRPHEAIDIAAARGSRVYAVDDGTVAKLFTSVPGGLTVYHFDPQRRLAYYYAHLDRYAEGLKEGAKLRRCDLIGYVGTTGNAPANAPHLHFAVFRLGPERWWWRGTALNPYPALKAGAPCR